jgi:hypothetical protein
LECGAVPPLLFLVFSSQAKNKSCVTAPHAKVPRCNATFSVFFANEKTKAALQRRTPKFRTPVPSPSGGGS